MLSLFPLVFLTIYPNFLLSFFLFRLAYFLSNPNHLKARVAGRQHVKQDGGKGLPNQPDSQPTVQTNRPLAAAPYLLLLLVLYTYIKLSWHTNVYENSQAALYS